MKKGAIAERIQRLLGGLKCEFLADAGREPDQIGKADAAVLKAAMSIAALDGCVSDAELAGFERLARKCRGYSAESAKQVFREGLRTAGYIELAARTLSAKELLTVFTGEVEKILPPSFALWEQKGVRRAFVMWIAMAMSDGDYSPIERKAIAAFAKIVSQRLSTLSASTAQLQCGFAASFVAASGVPGGAVAEVEILPSAFFARAEGLIAKLGRDATADQAARDLKSLILNG